MPLVGQRRVSLLSVNSSCTWGHPSSYLDGAGSLYERGAMSKEVAMTDL